MRRKVYLVPSGSLSFFTNHCFINTFLLKIFRSMDQVVNGLELFLAHLVLSFSDVCSLCQTIYCLVSFLKVNIDDALLGHQIYDQ